MPVDAIHIKVEGLEEARRDFARLGAQAKPKGSRAVRAISFLGERLIKIAMPVDTGRARASWGHWSPGDMAQGSEDASSEDAHWAEKDDGLTVEQGSNVEYVPALNAGHSQQAPAGFIDKVAERMARELVKELEKIINGF
jgi:hypothetical protein